MYDIGIEQAALGSVIEYPDTAGEVFEVLRPEDFWDPRHQLIAESIRVRLGGEAPITVTTLPGFLLADGHLQQIGGAPYLLELTRAAMSAANASYFATQVAALSQRRRLDVTSIRVQQIARNPSLNIDEVTAQVQDVVNVATTDRDSGTGPELFDADLDELLADLADPSPYAGLSTGVGALDDLAGRMESGQLIIIAGRPGMGKSVLGWDIARHVAFRQHEPVLVSSLEMSRKELQKRLLAAEADIPLKHLVQPGAGGLSDAEIAKARQARDRLAGAFLSIDDTPGVTLAQIRSRALRMRQQTGLALIVVDYLQLITPSSARDSRVHEVSEISRGLKLLAKELNVPVVVASQLNRGSEARSDKRPQMSDLRDSGSIEQDADVVILLHREDYYDSESPKAGEIELIVSKNRQGNTGIATAAAQFHKSRIHDLGRAADLD